MNAEYYKAPEIFRQNAISVKKTRRSADSGEEDGMKRRTCRVECSQLGSPLLRKVSGDLNDSIMTKKLRTDCWNLGEDTKDVTSMSAQEDVVLLSTSRKTDNLQLYQLRDVEDSSSKRKLLHSLQTISVPGNTVLTTDIFASRDNESVVAYDSATQDRIILSGHSDGYVNMISTSITDGNAKILRRFNHGKHLKVMTETSSDCLDVVSQLYNSHRSKPIRHLKAWNQHHFASIINNSLFFYDVNHQTRDPLYLHSFLGLEHVSANPCNPYTLSLTGTNFEVSGIALLDLRSDETTGLRVPGSSGCSNEGSLGRSYTSTWLDEYTVANSVGKQIKVWDIRYGEVKANMLGHLGYVHSLNYDKDLQKLYSTDDQGLIMSWDMKDLNLSNEGAICCRPSHGIQSFGLPETCVQNGNIIQSPDLDRISNTKHIGSQFVGLSNSHLISLQDQELKLFSVIDVPMVLPPPRNPLRLLASKLSKKQTDSSTTLLYTSSDDTHRDSNSAFEDSEDTLEYEAQSPMTPVLDSMFEGKMHNFDVPILPLLSGIRRESDATSV